MQVCLLRLKKINVLIQYFPGPGNKHLSQDNFIEIMVNMNPSHWYKSLDTINVEHMQKTLTQVVEYLECLEVLDATYKKSEN